MFDQLLSTATILVKNGPFVGDELRILRSFCSRMSFIPCYYPGMPKAIAEGRGPPMVRRTARNGGRGRLAIALPSPRSLPPRGEDLLQEDLYYYTLDSIFSGRAEAFYAAYPFSIRPATDDKPYYTAYVKPALLPPSRPTFASFPRSGATFSS